MPRPSKGARLWLKPEEIDKKTGRVRKSSVWLIRDGSKSVVTGCAADDFAAAEAALAEYLAEKHAAKETERDLPASKILVTDVLAFYAKFSVPSQARPDKADQRIAQLAEFWAGKMLNEVNGDTCSEYLAWRTSMPWKSAKPTKGKKSRMVTAAGVRRELEDLRAAINFHRKKGRTREVIEVDLPDRSPAKVRWLTREEAARLLWVCWRSRQTFTAPRGQLKGKQIETKTYKWRHIARFILVGLYTGTRASAITGAAKRRKEGYGYVDVSRGLFYRLAEGAIETNKRQPPVPLPDRLLGHVERWTRDRGEETISKEFIVEFRGKAVREVDKAFSAARKAAGLGPDVTPHVLRHTAATWLMQNGADLWSAAGYLGMSPELLQRVYGHHHPDYQESARAAIVRKPTIRLVEQRGNRGQNGDRNPENKPRRAATRHLRD
jgi:integrase